MGLQNGERKKGGREWESRKGEEGGMGLRGGEGKRGEKEGGKRERGRREKKLGSSGVVMLCCAKGGW